MDSIPNNYAHHSNIDWCGYALRALQAERFEAPNCERTLDQALTRVTPLQCGHLYLEYGEYIRLHGDMPVSDFVRMVKNE